MQMVDNVENFELQYTLASTPGNRGTPLLHVSTPACP